MDGQTVQISGSLPVDATRSCPILFEIVYVTSCTCDREEQYIENIPTRALRDFTEPLSMCPGECLEIITCDFVSVMADSIIGASGVVYEASIDWVSSGCYTFPRETVNGVFQSGPVGDFVNYTELTNNSTGDTTAEDDATGFDGLLFAENNACSGSTGDSYIVATYPQPVSVDSGYLGAGDVNGWSNTLSVFSSTLLRLEYSND